MCTNILCRKGNKMKSISRTTGFRLLDNYYCRGRCQYWACVEHGRPHYLRATCVRVCTYAVQSWNAHVPLCEGVCPRSCALPLPRDVRRIRIVRPNGVLLRCLVRWRTANHANCLPDRQLFIQTSRYSEFSFIISLSTMYGLRPHNFSFSNSFLFR